MKLMIIDGNSIVNRAFYGVHPLSAPDGTPTNAIFGFINILQRLLDEIRPDAVSVTFDLKAPTFRHKAYAGYKAQRKPMPDDLRVQIPLLKEFLDGMGIRRYEMEGYEADDLLGSAAAICEKADWDCVIVTGDKDSLQLITDRTSVCNVKTRMGQTETILYTPEVFKTEYGFGPAGIVDLKSLMGDSSDNIPGVPGIGEKTALDLVRKFGSLNNVYASLDSADIKDSVRKKLTAGKESADMSYWLATIVKDVPFHFVPEENLWDYSFRPELFGICKRFGFSRLIEKWKLTAPEEADMTETAAQQHITVIENADISMIVSAVNAAEYISVIAENSLDQLEICDGKAVYRAAWGVNDGDYDTLLQTVFSSGTRKAGHHIKELMRLLIQEGYSAEGFIFDTALAAYLLDATESDYPPERISVRYCGTEMSGAEAVFCLVEPLTAQLKAFGMSDLYINAELPLCEVLAEMEYNGFLVDKQALYDFGKSLDGSIALLQESIYSYAGHPFNINSTKQLGDVLFEELYLPSGKKTKTGWSTNADVLEKLRGKHPIINDILEYRTLTKLKSTYADGLLKVISEDGRIHTSFQMTVTATGRLSSTEPNLQNIPIRKAVGAQIRKMFVAAPGKILVDADYSQIELRLLAHISGDRNMQDAFLSGEDFHAVTASKVFNIPLEEVTPQLRSRAKAVNFGIVYGISAFSLAQDINVRPAEAKEYMDAYMEKYHGVRDYMESVKKQAYADGYVSTLYGRRRNMPELKSSNFTVRSFGERVALNMPIQGTAADVIKLAMVRVYRQLKEQCPEAKLLLQVHDELIVECAESQKDLVQKILKSCMESVGSFAVPLIAETGSGHSWAEAH